MKTMLKVLRFDHDRLHSICEVIKSDQFYLGQKINIDLTVNADFGEMPESELVGKVVEVDRFQPYEFIGAGVRIKASDQSK